MALKLSLGICSYTQYVSSDHCSHMNILGACICACYLFISFHLFYSIFFFLKFILLLSKIGCKYFYLKGGIRDLLVSHPALLAKKSSTDNTGFIYISGHQWPQFDSPEPEVLPLGSQQNRRIPHPLCYPEMWRVLRIYPEHYSGLGCYVKTDNPRKTCYDTQYLQ